MEATDESQTLEGLNFVLEPQTPGRFALVCCGTFLWKIVVKTLVIVVAMFALCCCPHQLLS